MAGKIKFLTIVLPLCLAGAMALPSQAKTNLVCTVVDENGSPVAKQQITLTSASGKKKDAKTNDQGEVKFGTTDDGTYTIGKDGAVVGRVEVSGTAQPCKYVAVSAQVANAKLQEVMQLIQGRKFPEAEAAAMKAVELMPSEGAAHYVLAVAYAYQGKDGADAEVKKAAELSPDKFKDKVAPIQMQALNAQAEQARAKNDIPGAIEKYNAILQISPDNPTVYYNMAVTYARANNFDLALKSIDKAIALKPDDAESQQLKVRLQDMYLKQMNKDLDKK